MKRAAIAIALLLSACGKVPSYKMVARESLSTFDVEESAAAPQRNGPQIAYSYTLSYALSDGSIAGVQAQAIAACRKLGVQHCLLVKTDINHEPGQGDAGTLNLLIDARLAAGFNQQLDGMTSGAGGSATGRQVTAEDLTKQIVDTGARIRAKQALADRLLGLIRTANGRVGDLVAAEKAYADVQEELDAARSLDAELRQRVAMSAIDITYSSTRRIGTWAPVVDSLGGVVGSFAGSVAALVTFVAAAVPWALLLALVIWSLRRIGWLPRWPWRRRRDAERSDDIA